MTFLAHIPGRRALAARLDRALRWRVDEAVGPLREQVERLDAQAGWTANEMERLQPHVAALDARIEDLRQALDDAALTTGPDDLVVARSVLDEIRREHAVVRERLSAASSYEERLRRLEDGAR